MSHFAIDLPEWEQEARLQYEADPLMDAALEVAASLTREQQLALLDSLGIDYSAYVEDDAPAPQTEAPKSKFDSIFGL